MKKCSVEDCTFNVFSNGFCKYHQFLRPDMTIRYINKKSKKREAQLSEYKENTIIPDEDTNKRGEKICFFCDTEIKGQVSHHHLNGRDGEKLNDKKYIVDSHNTCHVHLYHSSSLDLITKLNWYQGFLLRVKDIDVELWEKELLKQVKANIITNEEYLKLINQ
jgi:predicted GIY-YIG superfamily endonuclease